jgi:hypothetical protein
MRGSLIFACAFKIKQFAVAGLREYLETRSAQCREADSIAINNSVTR